MRTLLIAPHLDDEAISCGGLIQAREEVTVLAVHGRKYDYTDASSTELGNELEDFQKSSDILRFTPAFGNFEEGEPYKLGFYGLLEYIEKEIAHGGYSEIIIPSGDDTNQDHRHLNHLMQIVLRPINLGEISRVLEFIALDGVPRVPNHFVPLTQTMVETKLAAVAAYRRESRTGTSPRSPENMIAQMRVWGAMCGHEFAEGYKLKMERE